MEKIYESIVELVGNTPIIKLNNLKHKYSLKANLYAKLEGYNPAGSNKDRVALNMIMQAQKSGTLKKGDTIIEPTSGNTGIGIAMIGGLLGFKVIIVMPDNMSQERIKLIKAYGAEVVLTEGRLGMSGAISKAEEIQKQNKNSIIAGQFTNPANPDAHYSTTGVEIFNQLDGNVDIFVAGIGTGGTITGVGRYFKEQKNDVKIIGVEPLSSPLITQNKSGSHKIQGIGANFIPDILDLKIVDQIIDVSDQDALEFGREIAKTEGLFVGVSSGAVISAGIQLAKNTNYQDKNIVLLLPDSGYKYLSTELFDI